MNLSGKASLQPQARYALAQQELAKFADIIRITREQDSVFFLSLPELSQQASPYPFFLLPHVWCWACGWFQLLFRHSSLPFPLLACVPG